MMGPEDEELEEESYSPRPDYPYGYGRGGKVTGESEYGDEDD